MTRSTPAVQTTLHIPTKSPNLEYILRILDSTENLSNYLLTHKNKSIRIVTAFAGGTEHVVTGLLDQGNVVELIVGTINAFTSPDLIKYCADSVQKNFTSFVDFRYQSSIHWKLYLIDPDIVIIGSSNFTETGLSLERDTCLVIKNLEIYAEYGRRIDAIKQSPGVLEARHTDIFDNLFEQYRLAHDRAQARSAATKKFSTLGDWLADETNQSLQLFIWDGHHSSEDTEEATTLLEHNSVEGDSIKLRDFYTFSAKKNELPFEQGDVVICASRRGGHIGFYVFDRIIYSRNRHFIYTYRRNINPAPFDLQPLKANLKRLIPDLYENGQTTINRTVLKSLFINQA